MCTRTNILKINTWKCSASIGFISLGHIGSNISQCRAVIGANVKPWETMWDEALMFLHPLICVKVNACVTEPGERKSIHSPTCCYNGSMLLHAGILTLTALKAVVGARLLEIYLISPTSLWKKKSLSDGNLPIDTVFFFNFVFALRLLRVNRTCSAKYDRRTMLFCLEGISPFQCLLKVNNI